MTQFRSHIWVTIVVLFLALAVWVGNKPNPSSMQTQEADRVLEIERYPDEPMQLVNLRIGTQWVKDRIKLKFKDQISKWGTDTVKFKEKDDWIKRVSITLRNTSDKPVYGLEGFLFLKPIGYPMIFSLLLTGSRELRQNPLQPGAEIELTVSPGFLNHTLDDVKNHGADASRADVSFSLDGVIFSDDLHWYRGKLLRRDSAMPGKWVPVDEPVAVKRRSSAKPVSFIPASFKTAANAKPVTPVFSTCTQWNNSYQGVSCSGDASPDCITRTDLDDNTDPGLLSHVSVSGLCIFDGLSGQSCTHTTTHTRLQTDPSCHPCPDSDNDGYYDSSCGGNDCDDTASSVHPGTSENCWDGIDNNCDGLIDNQDTCNCPISEQDMWMPGGGYDCSLCQDGIDNDCDGNTDYADYGCNPNNCASPVLVDVAGNGFDLTSPVNGVSFDINGDGTTEKLSWTAPQTDDAWLALDRNRDGAINSGTELFGNFTPQSNPPPGYGRNGFNALVEFDTAAKGGNADGLITDGDAVFANLLLWQDTNHNGISEAGELHSLKQLGLAGIECNYGESKRKDRYGNLFRYRAKVRDLRNTQVGRWAWDVFLARDNGSVANDVIKPLRWSTTGAIREWLLE